MRGRTGTPTAVLTALLVGACAVGCASTGDRAGGTRPAAPLVLKVVNTRTAEEIQPFVDQVKRLSGGRIALNVTSQWHSLEEGYEPRAIKAVEDGQAAVGLVPTRAFHDSGVTSFDALGAPLTIDSRALEERVLSSGVATTMLQGLGPVGLHGLGVLPGPMRKPVGLTRSLASASDYRGATIAISASPVSERALAALGATPVASLFQGVPMSRFDGLEQQIESVAGNEYDAPGSSITANVNLWPRPLVLFANQKAFDALPASARGVLQEAAAAAVPVATSGLKALEAADVGIICRRGRARFVYATTAQLEQLRSGFAPVYAWLRADPSTATAIDQINGMRSGLEQAVTTETPTCKGTAGNVGQPPAVTPVDGVWQTTFSKAELAASPLNNDENNDGNWGTLTWTLAHGKFRLTQTNNVTHGSGSGTYTVTRDILTIHQDNGEVFTLRWSIYKNTLTLRRDESLGVGPLPLVLKPWTRLGR